MALRSWIILMVMATISQADFYGGISSMFGVEGDACEELHRAGIDPFSDDGSQLYSASRDGAIDTLKSLLDCYELKNKVADMINRHFTVEETTALHVANTPEMVSVLVGHGANIDIKDAFGLTPLHISAVNADAEIADVLLAEGAAVDALCELYWTPLTYAIDHKHEDMAVKLLTAGASVDVADLRGRTPLCHSAAHGYTALVKILLENNAAVDAVDNDGNTPLLLNSRSRRGNIETAKALVAAGAVYKHKNKAGETAEDIVVNGRKTSSSIILAEYLQSLS